MPTSDASERPPHHVGVTAAGCTFVGSVLVAVLMRSPMFLLLGAVGVVAAVGMWVAARVGAVRVDRRVGARRARELERFAAAVAVQRTARWEHHVATTPTVVDAVRTVTHLDARLWARRAEHADARRVSLGTGTIGWEVVVEGSAIDGVFTGEVGAVVSGAARFTDAPVPFELTEGSALAVTGPGAGGVLRAIVIQLAAWLGPADWRLLIVVDDVAAWDWAAWLPHGPGGRAVVTTAAAADGQAAALIALDDDDPRHVVVVTDRPDLLAQRTGALRRFIGARRSVAVVVHVPEGDTVPAMCRSVLDIGSIGVARWRPDASIGEAGGSPTVHVAGLALTDAWHAARALAGVRDPEDPALAADALARSVTLAELCEQFGTGPIDDAIAIAARWRASGPDPAPTVALGLAADGVVDIDLVRDGPHALLAGTTGSGKSELLRTLVVSLAARHSPDHLTFVLVDYKGGSTFDACAELPHTVGVVTDLDDRLAERALCSLDAEVRRREQLLREVGAADLAAYRADPGRPPLPRLVVVIDEFAALVAELPSFLSALVGIAQRGRSLGIHLVLATQRPGGVVDDEIRANTNLRVALRLHDAADARDVVGDDTPARFSRCAPGRAMLRLGPADAVVFQSARCTGPARLVHDERLHVLDQRAADATAAPSELDVLVRSIRNAAVLSDVAAPHRPWLPPLPAVLDGGIPAGAVGLVDVPAAQRRDPLRWAPVDGNLALLGSFGSGTTTALVAVLATVLGAGRDHVYVIDGRGDDRLDALGERALCGGVLRANELERIGRLLDRLVDELDRRRTEGRRPGAPGLVLGVDGVPALRTVLDAPGGGGRWEQLQRIVVEGAAVGLTCVLTGERPAAMPGPLLAACTDRWVFHLDDPSEAGGCGVRPGAVPPAVAGRIVVASTGCVAQLAVPSFEADGDGDSARSAVRPAPIGVLARSVGAVDLPAGRSTGGGVELVVGIDHETLGVARVTVPDGEHLLVAGPARSGRTTVLLRLAESWLEAHPGGRVLVVGRRDQLGLAGADAVAPDRLAAAVQVATGRPVLVVVDDAEHVDDPALAGLVAARRPGLVVLAAGRPVTLRAMYGHWTSVVRRSRLGLLMAACSDTDGDLLGELLPRHRPLPARPGLAWVVDGGHRRLVQVGWRPALSR